MSERNPEQRRTPSHQILAGLASATAIVSIMNGCSSDRDSKPSHDTTVSDRLSSFTCMGPPQYIRFPHISRERSYLLMHLEKRNGEPYTDATRVEIKDLSNDYMKSLPIDNTEQSSRAYVNLPRTVVQLTVEVYSGDESTSCGALLYPYKERPTFATSPSQ